MHHTREQELQLVDAKSGKTKNTIFYESMIAIIN